ncbi:MAG: hypothetical protein WBD22_04705 [Pyrinomonadaceae bacterium]
MKIKSAEADADPGLFFSSGVRSNIWIELIRNAAFFITILRGESQLDSLHDDSRFDGLVKRIEGG